MKKYLTIAAFALTLISCFIIQSNAGYFDVYEAQKAEAHTIAEISRKAGMNENCGEIQQAKAMYDEAQASIDKALDMLARVVYFEAGSSELTERHRGLVAAVVLNRCADERFPNTIESVINQKGQYACANKLYSVSKEQIPEYCYTAAKAAAYGEIECPPEVIYQSQGKQGTGVYERHFNTWFCFG